VRVPRIQKSRRSFGIRGWLIAIAAIIVVLLLSARGLARLYTDSLWFDEVGFSHTWRALIEAKVFPALIFSVIFFVFLFVDLIVADRLAPLARSAGPEDEIVERYRTTVEPYAGRIRFAVAAFFAIVMASGVASEWRDWILFSHSTKFGIKDPQFHRDIGFYVFKLPFLEFIAGWTFAALLVILIVTAVFHYLNGGIRLQTPFQRVTPQVKVHISVILALMALTKTVQYYLSRFGLTLSHRGVVDGATYTDVKAQLPALNLLMFISVAAAILFILNIFRRGWVFPIIAVGLWGFISIVVGTIYPAIIQRFVVQPNEYAREQTYIKRNIDATSTAFGLDKITVKPFAYNTDLTAAQATADTQTLDNARLWDPDPLTQVLQSTEEFQPFYAFSDVDVDRYDVNGKPVQTLTGVRELDSTQLPSNTWTTRHLVYTHGFGVDSARANSHSGDSPDYLLSDIPTTSTPGAPDLKQPDVYFGEHLTGYVVVKSKVAEQEANGETAAKTTQYSGDGGVRVQGLARRLAFALRFGDFNLIYSGQVTSNSRILYLRDVKERVQTAAPFLQWDADPYSVVLNGRITWMLDGYTTTDRYPYSQSINPQVPTGSGLAGSFNYVRNSVKATVDAYDGTMHFYVVDPNDPIIRTYRKAFPDLFQDVSAMPAGLQDHWRYPVDLFDTQTEQYTQYHMTDPQQFFQKAALWDVAPSPGVANATTAATVAVANGNNGGRNSTLASSGNPIDPLYLMMQRPGESQQEFVLERPFVPRAKANQLSSFLIAGNDGGPNGNYGKLTLYQVPDQSVAPSPVRASSLIEADPRISKTFSLLDQRGSQVVRGAAQLIPVDNTIFYVRPIYVEGSVQKPLPRWNYVAVTYGESAVLDTTVASAVQNLLAKTIPIAEQEALNGNVSTPTPTTTPTTSTTTPGSTPITAPPNATVAQLLSSANDLFNRANVALANQDLATFDNDYKQAIALVARANQLSSGSTPTTTPSSTSTPTSSTTRGAAATSTTAARI
jgi:uncharacterized protein